MFRVTVTGIRNLEKKIGAESRRQKKALETAIKVEGYKQLRILRDQIRKGQPGGHPYREQLSAIARRTKTGRMKKKPIPLYRLARLLRYNLEYVDGNLQMYFGFVDRGRRKISGSWKNLLLKHEEGADVLYSGSRSEIGREFAKIGGRLKKKGDPDARFFFLRRSTGRRIKIPKRSMTDTFMKTYDDNMKRNISNNFRRKMRGERI